jgi:hypothetical protein
VIRVGRVAMLPSGRVWVAKRQGVYGSARVVKPAGTAESAAAQEEATVGMHARQALDGREGMVAHPMASVTTLRFLVACTGP